MFAWLASNYVKYSWTQYWPNVLLLDDNFFLELIILLTRQLSVNLKLTSLATMFQTYKSAFISQFSSLFLRCSPCSHLRVNSPHYFSPFHSSLSDNELEQGNSWCAQDFVCVWERPKKRGDCWLWALLRLCFSPCADVIRTWGKG